MTTVRDFVKQSYRLISASNPIVPLQTDDQELMIRILNQLLRYYAANGLMLTIATTTSVPIIIGQREVVCGPPTYTPTPDITLGRLANVESAWIELDGVTYPLINKSRDEFLASYKYDPLLGLPRFMVVFAETDVVRIRLYPAPSQAFTFSLRAKFQLTDVTSNDTLDSLPAYYERFFLLAVARDTAFYKGRASAWTQELEALYTAAKDVIESASEVNLSITGDEESLLNGAWRVRSGI